MTKVLIIVYDFPPRVGGGGVLRTVKLAKYLKSNGFEPFILTVNGNKQATSDNSLIKDDLKNIKIFYCNDWLLKMIPDKFYKKNDEITNSNNNSKRKNYVKEILKKIYNLLLLDRGIGSLYSGFKTACSIIENEKIDVVYTTSPPHTPHIIGYKLKKKYGIKHIMDFRDSWYKNPLHDTNIIKTLFNRHEESKTSRNADFIITTSSAVERYFKVERKLNNVQTILNGYDEDDFKDIDNIQFSSQNEIDKFQISYIGSLGGERTLKYFLEAIENLKGIKNKSIINIVGNVDSQELSLINSYKDKIDIRLIGNVSHKEAIKWMLISDSLLILLPISQDGMKAIPGKIFEYIRAQKPILGLCEDNSELSKIIINNKFGLTANFVDINNIAKAINNLYQYKYNNGILADNYNVFSRKFQFDKLKEIVLKV